MKHRNYSLLKESDEHMLPNPLLRRLKVTRNGGDRKKMSCQMGHVHKEHERIPNANRGFNNADT